MSYKYKQFTVESSLQHITMVKTSQQLWRHSDVSKKVRKFVQHLQDDPRIPWDSLESKSNEITAFIINKKLDKLILPTTIKDQLRYYIEEMGIRMFKWLRDTVREMIEKNHENYNEKISHFVENIFWDDLGCVDGKKILESYVRNKESIDFDCWSLLCCYCSEDNIRKFSDFDWNNKINSTFSVFWYHKIHGEFPKEEMFSSSTERIKLLSDYEKEGDEDNHIVTTLLMGSIAEGNLSAVKYCWNQLKDNEKQEIISTELCSVFSHFDKDYSDVYVYLLGQMDDLELSDFFETDFNIDEVLFLTNFPWILCISTWENFFKSFGSEKKCIWSILLSVSLKILREKPGWGMCEEQMGEDNEEIKELKKRNFREFLYNKYCQVFEELWEIGYKDIVVNLDSEYVISIIQGVLLSENIELCKKVFGGKSEERKKFLEKLADCEDFTLIERCGGNFYKKFMKEVLKNEDERVLLKKLLPEYFG